MSNNFLWSNMLYYWQTKYTTLIYIPFFIFPHNRHFFVHISSSVLEVRKFPCGRTPFQPSEDTDALLSELPPLSHNVVHAADLSQIRKDGSRRVPDQGYRRGVEELPTQEGCGRTSHPIFAIASDVRRAAWGRAFSCRMMMFRPGRLLRNARRSLCSVWT